MKKPATKGGTRQKAGRRAPPVRPPKADKETPRERKLNERFDRLDQVAATWVAAVRDRVAELARIMGRIDYLMSHPDDVQAAPLLPAVFHMPSLCRLRSAIEEAECAVADLLDPSTITGVPDLPGAIRECAALLAAMKAERK
jgi:hypothetical protein